MKNYSSRCANWLENNKAIDEAILNRELRRFTQMLEKIESDEVSHEAETIDDLLATLNLLEARLDADRPVKTLDVIDNDADGFGWDSSPLYAAETHYEVLDKETKLKKLEEVLKHQAIQKGFKKV